MPVSRLALKIALGVGAGVGVAESVLRAVWAHPERAASVAVSALVAAVLAGGLAHVLTARRLARARAVLDTEPARTDGDELDALVSSAERRAQAFQTEVADLRKAANYRREFLGNVSHELKTPVFAIQGFAETLLDGALDDDRVRRSFVEKILRNVTRLQALTRDLTELARLETGELTMTRAPFSLPRLVAEVAETAEVAAAARGVALTIDAPDDVPAAWGDRERIRHVVSNLVDNAVKYTPEGGRVTVSVRSEGGGRRVAVAVADTGVGIAAEHLPRLTERFYRVDASRSREVGGTGLGLAIVKHVLAAHDERLEIASAPGAGSTFGFALPAAPART